MPARHCIAALMLIMPIFATAAQAAEFAVTLLDAKGDAPIYLQVFADAKTFAAKSGGVAKQIATPAQGTATAVIANLKPGRYAIAAFQDSNGNGTLDTNFLGVPKEPYGFSNDATGTMGPPGFDQAAVDLGEARLAITIHLH